MMRKTRNDLEVNQEKTSLEVFMKNYNENLPKNFPHVSAKTLNRFKTENANIFKDTHMWSIDKHRKRVMDWLSSHRSEI